MDRAPSYLSSAKAESILSEVRPTKIRTETLICVNVFLDELLWLVLSTARSFSTERLKIGLVKVLPTTLGKEALLEAEVELKAYWEKTGINVLRALESAPSPSPSEFPLQAAFELLRHKCEAYSTLGDLDEDADVEARLQNRMMQAVSNPPNTNAVAPAALYLTAVLEHICEHLLGNVARVVGRDASRSTAQVGDLYVALCEDETVYGLFKNMKVQEQIERQSKNSRNQSARRSKSFSRGETSSPSRTTSPQPQAPPSSADKARSVSTDGGLLSPHHAPSPSSDKGRGLKMFKSSDSQSGKEHHRTTSVMSESTKRTLIAFNDQEAEGETGIQDFDDLMKSGATMKVSLTPDRLKTFEVHNKQKLAKVIKPSSSPAPSANAEPPPPFKSIRPVASTKSIGRAQDLIDDPPLTPSKRNHSIATPAEVGIRLAPIRRGSDTSTNPPPQANSALLRKASLGNAMNSGPSAFPGSRRPGPMNGGGDPMGIDGMPKRNRPQRGPARNRESLDLDDVMDVGDEEISFGPPPMQPKSAAPAATSSSTRDLIDFLSEGPPEANAPPLPPLQTNGLGDKPAKSGRFKSMFSRSKQSSETLSISAPIPPSTSSRTLNGPSNPNSLGRSNSSLKKQRSAGNLSAPRPAAQPFPMADYPRPPNYARTSAPPSPTLSSSAVAATAPESSHANGSDAGSTRPPEGQRSRHHSVSRKAVPAWDGAVSSPSLPVPSPTMSPSPRSPSETRPPPSPKASMSSTSVTTRENGSNVNLTTPVATAKESIPSPISPSGPSPSSKRSGLIPVARSAGIPNLPAAEAVDVSDMRKKLAKATSVQEARLLVDMFLAQWGFPAGAMPEEEIGAPPIVLNGSAQDDSDGVGVVEMLLGGGADRAQDETSRWRRDNSITSSPTVSEEPLTPSSSHPSSSRHGHSVKNIRVDVRPLPSAPGSTPSTPQGTNIAHNSMHHHRYGNNSPVIVG